jgi:hypothetical protein
MNCRYCQDKGQITINFKTKPCLDCPPKSKAVNREFKYGFFSKKAQELSGSVLYQSFDDPTKEIEVTCVDSDPQAPTYKWGDKVCVGKVGKCLYIKKSGI